MRSSPLFLGLLLCLYGWSQPPTQTPLKGTQGKQQQGSPKEPEVNSQDGQSKSGVTIVNQLYPEPENRNVAEGKEDKNQSAFADTLTAFSTLLLAIFTLLLAVATSALCIVAVRQWRTMQGHEQALASMQQSMIDGLAETRKAADAAMQSAQAATEATRLTLDTFVLSQRPRIIVRNVSCGKSRLVLRSWQYP